MAGRPAGRSVEEKGQRWGNTLNGQSAAFQGFRNEKCIYSWCFSVGHSAIQAFLCVKHHGSHERLDCTHHLWLNLSFTFSRSLTTAGRMSKYLQPHRSCSAGAAPPASRDALQPDGLLCRWAQREERQVDARRPTNSKNLVTSFHLKALKRLCIPHTMIYVGMWLNHIQLFSIWFKPNHHKLKFDITAVINALSYHCSLRIAPS